MLEETRTLCCLVDPPDHHEGAAKHGVEMTVTRDSFDGTSQASVGWDRGERWTEVAGRIPQLWSDVCLRPKHPWLHVWEQCPEPSPTHSETSESFWLVLMGVAWIS